MRALRNVAIIVLVAVPIAFLPGGGNVADAALTALVAGFLAAIAFSAYGLYRRSSFTLLSLDESGRALLYGAVGLLVLMIAGTDELLSTGLGALVWIAAIALAVLALVRVWRETQSY